MRVRATGAEQHNKGVLFLEDLQVLPYQLGNVVNQSVLLLLCLRFNNCPRPHATLAFPGEQLKLKKKRCFMTKCLNCMTSVALAERRERTNSLPDSPTASHLCPVTLGYFLAASPIRG
ncbi:hypothetical protein EYF80_005626 [Liparis tanakae]|uniref:Uncharacterized protein n=1 Tax=Liparis tanakae TaxID=230148 RepID=A0A4Z2J259_9TELE|nr:hypothetical protein EYF80_005626 [Liparis tanakae]